MKIKQQKEMFLPIIQNSYIKNNPYISKKILLIINFWNKKVENIEKLWKKFNQLEVFDEPLTDKLRICINLEDIKKGNHSQKWIKLEKDLLYFYAKILNSFDEVQISENKLNYYNNTLKRFNEIQGDEDFNYYKQRFSETVNQSDKIRYGQIVWLYFKDITFFWNINKASNRQNKIIFKKWTKRILKNNWFVMFCI